MKLKLLASKLGREFRGDGEVEIIMPAPIEAAGPGTVIFVANEKYAPMLETTTASCVIVPEQFAARAKCAVLLSPNPYFDFSRALEIFFPPPTPKPGVDSTAHVAPDAVERVGAIHTALVARVRRRTLALIVQAQIREERDAPRSDTEGRGA